MNPFQIKTNWEKFLDRSFEIPERHGDLVFVGVGYNCGLFNVKTGDFYTAERTASYSETAPYNEVEITGHINPNEIRKMGYIPATSSTASLGVKNVIAVEQYHIEPVLSEEAQKLEEVAKQFSSVSIKIPNLQQQLYQPQI